MVHVCHRFYRLFSTLKAVGPHRFIRAIYFRIRQFLVQRLPNQIFDKKAQNDAWGWLCTQYGGENAVVSALSNRTINFWDEIAKSCCQKELLAYADRYAVGEVDIFGSSYCFDAISWHEDFHVCSARDRSSCFFNADAQSCTIPIVSGMGSELSKDIRVVWEFSRFHHVPVLACAYRITGDARYVAVAKKQLDDWIEHNVYPRGVNWVSPMEVAIRAVNWIVALQWLSDEFSTDRVFYKRLISCLYTHMRHLEHNWEFYDGRTSNHYVANLVGYLYLCWFFDGVDGMHTKRDWCLKELFCELEWQIFDEGTLYEGSTSYHRLVTEFVMHAFLLARSMGMVIEGAFMHKLERMVEFIAWCKAHKDSNIVLIGDGDSGSLVHSHLFAQERFLELVSLQPNVQGLKQYGEFGLSIVKTSEWHVTLRHHVYTPRQPSGHFHNDSASITLSYRGIPILIDPGSYVYTASSWWRNQFRSAKVHNTVSILEQEPWGLNGHLFSLPITPARTECAQENNSMSQGLITTHQLYDGMFMRRRVIVAERECSIEDHVTCALRNYKGSLVWNFTFAPTLIVKQHGNEWFIVHDGKVVLVMTSPSGLFLTPYQGWVSMFYGTKIRSYGLRAILDVGTTHQNVCFRAVN